MATIDWAGVLGGIAFWPMLFAVIWAIGRLGLLWANSRLSRETREFEEWDRKMASRSTSSES